MMTILDWICSGDQAVSRLAHKYLLEKPYAYSEKGFIKDYLDLFDNTSQLWGGGVYSPKWISTHYTMRELMYLEVDSKHPYYQSGIKTLVNYLWRTPDHVRAWKKPDMCVVAMVVSMAAYGAYKDDRMHEMVDHMLDHQLSDGGWNCQWNRVENADLGASVHTTLAVLEALRDYALYGDGYRMIECDNATKKGQAYLLERSLVFRKSSGQLMNKHFDKVHYPTRWYYDYLRALEYFASVAYPYDQRLEPCLDLVRDAIKKGYMPKGSQYGGKRHFDLETTRGGRINTYRALKVLKHFDLAFYHDMCSKTFKY